MSETTIGHNAVSGPQLRQYIERIEGLLSEKKALQEDIKEIFTMAGDQGYDARVMRQVIKIRAMEEGAWEEHMNLVDLYRNSVTTP